MKRPLNRSSPLTAGSVPVPDAIQTFLVGRIGTRMIALPASAVVRVLAMATVTALPDLSPVVLGVLNLQGAVLPVVAPHTFFGLPTPPCDPHQHLVVISSVTNYILWLDRVERVVSIPVGHLASIEAHGSLACAPFVLRLDGELVPVLSPEALDPGRVVLTTADGKGR